VGVCLWDRFQKCVDSLRKDPSPTGPRSRCRRSTSVSRTEDSYVPRTYSLRHGMRGRALLNYFAKCLYASQ
jgi:hypothetical protein